MKQNTESQTALFNKANIPKVSIGMPVYNGGKYIRQALDSLLGQDYENIELIISDNASNDDTTTICREYCTKIKGIRYYRNENNMGASLNFNRVFELSTGKYFMWAADHDLWHPNFISRCVSVLECDSNAVLSYSRTILIDPNGNPLGIMPDQIDTRGMPDVRRFKYIIWNLSWCNMVYGVILSKALKQTGLFRNVWGPDTVLLAELAFRGTFAQINDPLFYRRRNRPDLEEEMYKQRVLNDLDPTTAAEKSKKSLESLLRDLRKAHFQIVFHAPINFFEKIDTLLATAVCFKLRYNVGLHLFDFAKWIVMHIFPHKVQQKLLRLVQSC